MWSQIILTLYYKIQHMNRHIFDSRIFDILWIILFLFDFLSLPVQYFTLKWARDTVEDLQCQVLRERRRLRSTEKRQADSFKACCHSAVGTANVFRSWPYIYSILRQVLGAVWRQSHTAEKLLLKLLAPSAHNTPLGSRNINIFHVSWLCLQVVHKPRVIFNIIELGDVDLLLSVKYWSNLRKNWRHMIHASSLIFGTAPSNNNKIYHFCNYNIEF